MLPLPLSLLILSLLPPALADVTIYTTLTTSAGSSAATASSAAYTGYAAFDPTTIAAPAPPSPPQPSTVPIALYAGGMDTLSIPQKGNLLGFSVELSVSDTIIGKNSSVLNVPFLNYLNNIRLRAGAGPILRVGGNSQETETLFVSGLPDGAELDKINQGVGADGVINTPIINFSPELLYVLSNVSELVNAQWYFGLAFNDTAADENALLVAQWAQDVLGDNLLALQLGNEPDLYGDHGKRDPSYNISDYMTDFAKVEGDLMAAPGVERKQTLVGPSICCNWAIGDVLDAGYLTQFGSGLAQVSVQHYPANNCKLSGVIDPEDIFPSYLNHSSAQAFVAPYLAAVPEILAAGKPMVLLETNTASCGGFLGVSDSFGATLWTIDLALQLAWANFTAVLLHTSGTSVYYNPVTPPPGNETRTKQWNTGSTYYAMLAVAETFGSSNVSQIVDLGTWETSIYAPSYAIYENGAPTRVALFNFVSDPSGANDYTATITLSGGSMPASVNVRYLSAPSVSEKYNITWAGQTLSPNGAQSSDGVLHGSLETEQIACDTTNNVCNIPMQAPSFALVFLSQEALQASTPQSGGGEALSFTPTATVGGGATGVDPGVLETSNGGVLGDGSGSTSKESGSRPVVVALAPSAWGVLLLGVLGALAVGW
ncbi:glycoside hydrolase family 79 protein [Calocera viscosa TUFC12733]|uniref:Glycoside hydrolase family 79 protein n=1 Tax=Calocera viscosa (strain TUFC12733) TaxID=1330018 RepID=A0A167HI61_CALVF|nr:glycoside hydrolase family 79 protein [Calocera viscosa TUFC12733]